MKPMLAANIEVSAIRFPTYASAKLDGVRAIVINGKLVSRNLKPIPNVHVSKLFSCPEFNGLDGELICGDPTAKNVFQATMSAVSSQDGTPDVSFYVFDNYLRTTPFSERIGELMERAASLKQHRVIVVGHALVQSVVELRLAEEIALTQGYEGLILRSPSKAYKHGRSTPSEQGMLKVKRFIDSEAVVVGVIEEMANNNLAMTNALGRTERSTAKAGLTPKGTMGALAVRDIHSGVEFQIGTGFTAQDRYQFWKHRDHIVASKMVVKYKCFPIGVKDLPRFPVYLGVRAAFDTPATKRK